MTHIYDKNEPLPQGSNFFKTAQDYLLKNPWRIFETIAIIAAILALLEAIEGNRIAREQAKQSNIINAWNILNGKQASGPSGKKEALETLYRNGVDLRNIDLSCISSKQNTSDEPCLNASFLRGAKLTDINLSNSNLSGAYLSGAYLSGANLSNAKLISANLSDAKLISANLSNANLTRANLTDAKLYKADFFDSELSGTNLSNVSFCHPEIGCANNITQEQLDYAWAWDDQLPKFGTLDLQIKSDNLCSRNLRLDYIESGKTGRPGACFLQLSIDN